MPAPAPPHNEGGAAGTSSSSSAANGNATPSNQVGPPTNTQANTTPAHQWTPKQDLLLLRTMARLGDVSEHGPKIWTCLLADFKFYKISGPEPTLEETMQRCHRLCYSETLFDATWETFPGKLHWNKPFANDNRNAPPVEHFKNAPGGELKSSGLREEEKDTDGTVVHYTFVKSGRTTSGVVPQEVKVEQGEEGGGNDGGDGNEQAAADGETGAAGENQAGETAGGQQDAVDAQPQNEDTQTQQQDSQGDTQGPAAQQPPQPQQPVLTTPSPIESPTATALQASAAAAPTTATETNAATTGKKRKHKYVIQVDRKRVRLGVTNPPKGTKIVSYVDGQLEVLFK